MITAAIICIVVLCVVYALLAMIMMKGERDVVNDDVSQFDTLNDVTSSDESNTMNDVTSSVTSNTLNDVTSSTSSPVITGGDIHASCFHLNLQPSDVAIIIGDIHGSLLPLPLIKSHLKQKHYVICLGDYHDRGPYSEKVMKTLLNLRKKYSRLYLLVGNHEFDYIKKSELTPDFMMNHLYHAGVITINNRNYFVSHAGCPVEKDYKQSNKESLPDLKFTYQGQTFIVNENTLLNQSFQNSSIDTAINESFNDISPSYFALLSILTWRDYTSEKLSIPYSNREHIFDTATYEELFTSMKHYNIDVVVRGHQAFTPLWRIIDENENDVKEKRITDEKRYCVTLHSTDVYDSAEPNYMVIDNDGFEVKLL